MIFGCISLTNELDLNQINRLSSILGWSNSVSYNYNNENFFSACLIDKSFRLSHDWYFFSQEDGIYVIIDGFIFNKIELCNKLSVSQNISLSNLVFLAYKKWGDNFADLINGDFAIIIYQNGTNRISFFRDHVGIRALSFAQIDTFIYFSTDTLGLCKALNNTGKLNQDYLINYFLNEGYNYNVLPNEEVTMVPPGNYVQIDKNGTVTKPFWFPDRIQKDKKLTFFELVSELETILIDAVKIRADKNFNASAHVSGGLDSGIVAALARKEFSDQDVFYGISWSPDYYKFNGEFDFDERKLVEEICVSNLITPIYINFNCSDILKQMNNWRFPSEFIFENRTIEIMKVRKINLIFSGWGGDEFISIGNRGVDADLIKELNWRSFIKKYPLNNPRKIIYSIIYNVLFPSAKRPYLKYKARPEIYPYLKNILATNQIPLKQRFNLGSRRKVHIQLLNLGHLSKRTSDWYILGQHNGIEYRYPLLDKRIIEYMMKVPSRCLIGGNNHRILLRNIGKKWLPNFVLENKSKDDPVSSYFLTKFSSQLTESLIKEFDDFRSNPYLNFIDFELIKRDILQFKKNKDKNLQERIFQILYSLKSASAFVNGYYN